MSAENDSSSLQVLLFRHPQTDWNLAQRYQGTSDRPWSEDGKKRAAEVAEDFSDHPFDQVLSSPREHAHALSERLISGSGEILTDDRWAEIDHGNWEGLTYEEVARRYPESSKERFDDPCSCQSHEGETLLEINTRVLKAWTDLSAIEGPRIAVVTHATPIQLILCHISGTPIERHWQFRIDCGSVSSFELFSGATIINYCNRV